MAAALIGSVLAAAFCPKLTKHTLLDIPPELAAVYVLCSGADLPGAPDDGKAPEKPCDMCLAATGLNLLIAIAAFALLFMLAPVRSRHAPSFILGFTDFLRRDGLHSRAPPLPA